MLPFRVIQRFFTRLLPILFTMVLFVFVPVISWSNNSKKNKLRELSQKEDVLDDTESLLSEISFDRTFSEREQDVEV